MAFNYWYLSNLQIFGNTVISISNVNDVTLSGHSVVLTPEALLKLTPSFPALLLAVLMAALIPFSSIVASVVEIFKRGVFSLGFVVDEDLPNYFTAVDASDKKFIIEEEENMRLNYVRRYC